MKARPLPTGDEKVAAVRTMFDTIAPRYELVNRLLTFGLDARWRRTARERLGLAPGSTVLDLACGTGDFCRLLRSAGLQVIGVDLSIGMLQAARTDAPLLQADVLHLPMRDGAVDGITCGFALRNLVELPGFFEELGRVVRPGGRIVLLDASRPSNRIARAGHGVYFTKFVPFVGGLLSDRDAYRYLPQSLAYLPPVDAMLSALRSAGFTDVERKELTLGAAQLITATRAG